MAGKYFTRQDREEIAKAWASNASVLEIAEAMGVHRSTVYRELKLGETEALDVNQRHVYDPEQAQRRFQENLRNRGKRQNRPAATA